MIERELINEGWEIHDKHPLLNENYAVKHRKHENGRIDTAAIVGYDTEKPVNYKPSEVRVLAAMGNRNKKPPHVADNEKCTLRINFRNIHNIKKVFDGELMEVTNVKQ